ncbi:hypothetical protein HanXRQr2_Chr12g0527841 [Helianthus annuus]|uniref:Uncharacterized protein n=1 Tax=Helianthus annuus TaxID=4232 RepID=A0A251T2X3_HELAN|nr:hypothetical protein HanXRQr2_Chr12g0527841 [Helianthus annuus]KAJ0571651.1 hypothetical protein HanHA300_Chr05g0192541 [Helianthus annuus]KAJ0748512.1 hypothetical protein HanOQP8_Chr05g0201971 [Helianthus annuus]KAJ0924316.1 hypothetical protein HanPSC8_Chr05g0226801 [Helianthus annuus]
MNQDSTSSSPINHLGSCRDGIKHGRLTGQEVARKRIRARMHKVSDSVITS